MDNSLEWVESEDDATLALESGWWLVMQALGSDWHEIQITALALSVQPWAI